MPAAIPDERSARPTQLLGKSSRRPLSTLTSSCEAECAWGTPLSYWTLEDSPTSAPQGQSLPLSGPESPFLSRERLAGLVLGLANMKPLGSPFRLLCMVSPGWCTVGSRHGQGMGCFRTHRLSGYMISGFCLNLKKTHTHSLREGECGLFINWDTIHIP